MAFINNLLLNGVGRFRSYSIVSSSNKMWMSSGVNSFKDLSKSLASDDDVQIFDQFRSTKKSSKAVSIKKKFAVKKAKNPDTNLPAKKSSSTIPLEIPTFSQVLENSKIFRALNETELEAQKFLKKSAEFFVDKEESAGNFDLSSREVTELLHRAEQIFPIGKPDEEELEKMTVNKPTFTLARIVNESPSMKKLLDLGVNLSHWEKMGKSDIAMSLDFESDISPKIRFFVDLGIRPEDLGYIFTYNPNIFKLDPDDLQVRIDYLKSKNFTKTMITNIIIRCESRWLNFSVVDIDTRLGFFQKTFGLTGEQVRKVAETQPGLIIWKGTPFQVDLNKMTVIEGMGFTAAEARQILLKEPRVFMHRFEEKLQNNFELLHTQVGLSHEQLANFPSVLLAHRLAIRDRNNFLVKLGKNQYNPSLPNYVSPPALAESSDEEFCLEVAKVPIDIFNQFLKTI